MDIIAIATIMVLVICSGGCSHSPQYKRKEAHDLDKILDPRD